MPNMSKSKKPDRFNAMVEKLIPHEEDCVAHVHAASLLRKQHRAVVRLVHQLRLRARKAAFATVLAKKRPDWHDAKIEVLDDLLTALARRSK